MTKWYKYSLKEYGITSKPIFLKKESFKKEEKGSNINDQKNKAGAQFFLCPLVFS